MTNSRTKGHGFEREIVNLFKDELGYCKRNLDQYAEKDHGDIILKPFCVECKRYANGHWHREDWWNQVVKSAGDKYIPLLVYRFDRQPTKFVFPLFVVGDYVRKDNETFTVCTREAMLIMREVISEAS
ncbi:MAG: hypothetical protein VXU43_02965 [Pseudomonadota bacterium]|nr:hypothetical protein [Pseudomonadota bacterium]